MKHGIIATLILLALMFCAVDAMAATRWDVVVQYRCPGRIVTATYRHKSLERARETKATLDKWERTVRSYIRRVEI
jgi:hypothetical protein